MRDPFTRWPRAADAVLAIVVFLWSVFISDEPNQDLAIRTVSDLPLAAIFVYIVASGALYWRRYQPLLVLGVDLAALALLMGLGPYSLWAMPFALYSVGRYAISDQWNYYGVTAALAPRAYGLGWGERFIDGTGEGNRTAPANRRVPGSQQCHRETTEFVRLTLGDSDCLVFRNTGTTRNFGG